MRPKKISDSRLLELSTDIIVKKGPKAFTLRRIAKHAQVSPATLIKRFGSRNELLKKCISHHILKINDSLPDKLMRFEDFIDQQSKNYNQDNIIQNISLLANDMTEPALNKIAKKYFEGFRKSLLFVLHNDQRFDLVSNKEKFAFQLEAIFHGAIIQGAFLPKFSIKINVHERLSQYIKEQCHFDVQWS